MPSLPTACKEKSSDYLACSDDIYEWFCTLYEKVDEEDAQAIKVSDVFDEFQSSSLFYNMSKADKRKYTKKYFNEKIQTNLFLQEFYRPADKTYKKVKQRTPFLIGFRTIAREVKDTNDEEPF